MNYGRVTLMALLATALLGVPAVMAEQPMEAPVVSCSRISQAIKSGKTHQQVAKDLKVSLERVRECTKPAK